MVECEISYCEEESEDSSRRGERLQALGGGRLEWLLHRDGSHDPTATFDTKRKALDVSALFADESESVSRT